MIPRAIGTSTPDLSGRIGVSRNATKRVAGDLGRESAAQPKPGSVCLLVGAKRVVTSRLTWLARAKAPPPVGRKVHMDMITSGAKRTMSSREIAELTEKNHADVLRDIRNMLEQLGVTASSFAGSYKDSTGRTLPAFDLPEDLTITLVSGYSVQMRHRIVRRWRELESRNTTVALPNFADPVAAARAWADATESKIKAEAALALAAPKVEFVDRYVTADTGAKGFRQVCKLLGANEARFREFVVDRKILYRLGGEWSAYQCHIDAGRFEVKTGEANGHAFNRCLFTPKGVEWVAGEWAKHQIRGEVSA